MICEDCDDITCQVCYPRDQQAPGNEKENNSGT